jgi:hypothetical protein
MASRPAIDSRALKAAARCEDNPDGAAARCEDSPAGVEAGELLEALGSGEGGELLEASEA